MAKARYFVEVKKFTSLHGSELLTDGDFTIRKLAERTFFSEATHHISDPNMLVLLWLDEAEDSAIDALRSGETA